MNTRSNAGRVANADHVGPCPEPLDPSAGELADLWNQEHADLAQHTDQLHRWLAEASHQEILGYGELALQLKSFRDRLLDHFGQEEDLGQQLQELCDCAEMTASRRQIASDHEHLMLRLDSLIERLIQAEPPFGSFGRAVDEVGLFLDAFELHEEQETLSLQWLTARPLDFRNLPR